jgi:hypothetical protein
MVGRLSTSLRAGEQTSPNAVTKEKAAEIAADFMTTFYYVQIGALETQEFRAQPVPFWLVCFSDAIKGPLRQIVLCCRFAGWQSCGTERVEAAVFVVGKRIELRPHISSLCQTSAGRRKRLIPGW